jgi:hypothetical protein
MKRDEAQFILRAYRANSDDALDPQFQAALELAKQDSELAKWFAEEQAVDAAFARHVRAGVPVPPNLQKQLLLLRATTSCRPWWRRSAWVGIAASIAVVLGATTVTWWRSIVQGREAEAQLGAFRVSMVGAVDRVHHEDVAGLRGEELRRWLRDHGGDAGFVLPAGLTEKDIMACKIVGWRQQQVTMLCLKIDGKHTDLFVVDMGSLPRMPVGAEPRVASVGSVGTAAWRRDGKLYLLVANRPAEELKRLI